MRRLLVDGHVHFHDCYDEAAFLAAAYANLSGLGDGLPTLFLTEMSDANVFARWKSGRAAWSVRRTDEDQSLILGDKLLILAGRQIVTAERIEVIALLTSELFEDGCPLDETIKQVKTAGALAVLPWGAGKWFGTRGRSVAGAAVRHSLLLGDNGGRPLGWPKPKLFREHCVLPGSDPLRLKTEQRTVGTYGFRLTCELDLRYPARFVGSALRRLRSSPEVIGRRATPLVFLRQQLGLRITKRF